MELPKRAQQTIAGVSGAILLGIVIVLIVRHFAPAFTIPSLFASHNPQDKQESSLTVDGRTDTISTVTDQPHTEPPTGDAVVKENQSDTKTVPQNSISDFTYVAVAGDSYTAFARKAIQEYSTANKLNLTPAQALDAEITLTNNAGAPMLDIGQSVAISEAAVAALVGATTEVSSTSSTSSSDKTSQQTNTNKTADYSHNFTAATGDSYSTLARSAISSYVSTTGTILTGAQRVAAESQLAVAAGASASALTVGQVVSFDPQAIKRAVTTATSLSDAELSAWQPYAVLAGL